MIFYHISRILSRQKTRNPDKGKAERYSAKCEFSYTAVRISLKLHNGNARFALAVSAQTEALYARIAL